MEQNNIETENATMYDIETEKTTMVDTETETEKEQGDFEKETSTLDEFEEAYDVGKAKAAKKPAAKREKNKAFPKELENFGFADRRFLICDNEQDPTKENGDEYLEVAMKIEGYPNEDSSFDITKLSAKNLRQLAKQFGSSTKFQLLLAMSQKTVRIVTILMH